MATVVAVARASNTVTMSTNYRHGLAVSQSVRVLGFSSSERASWQGVYTLTAVSNGGTATISSVGVGTGVYTTSAAHGFAVGQYVTVTGSAAANNGAWLITAVGSTTTFTVANSSSVASAAGTATTSPWVQYTQVLAAASLTAATEPNMVVYPIVTVRPNANPSNDGWVATGTTSLITAVNDTSLSTYIRKPSSSNSYSLTYNFTDPASAVSGQFIWCVGFRLGLAMGSAGNLSVGTGTPSTWNGYSSLTGTITAPGSAGVWTADYESALTGDTTVAGSLLWSVIAGVPYTQTNLNNLQMSLTDRTVTTSSRATVYEVWGDVLYGTLPYLSAAPVASGTTTTSRPTVTWTHLHSDSWAQVAYQVKVFTSAQANPLTATGAVYDSGYVLTGDNSETIGADLINGATYYVYVRTAVNPWAQFGQPATSGNLQWSTWGSGTSTSFVSFTMSLTPPRAVTTSAAWTSGVQGFTVTSTGASFASGTQTFTVERSTDGGSTWTTLRDGSGLTPNGSFQTSVIDYEADRDSSLTRYRTTAVGDVGGNIVSTLDTRISSIAFSTPTVTVTTAANHGLSAGMTVVISGATTAANDGTFTVATAPTGTTFTVSNASGAAQASAGGSVTQIAVATPTSDNTWWVKAPLTPALNRGSVQVQAEALPVTHEESIGVFRPYGRTNAVVVSGVLGGKDGSLEVFADGATEWAAVRSLLLAQETLLVQDPLGDQKYIRITRRSYDLAGNRQRPQYRANVDYVEVDAP